MTLETYCREICKANFANKVQMEKALAEYDAGLKAQELRKFAAWMQENNYHIFAYFMTLDDGVDTKTIPFDEVLAEYEKEQKNE